LAAFGGRGDFHHGDVHYAAEIRREEKVMATLFAWLDSWPLVAVIGFFVAVYVALEAISMWRK
jgi:hypothetical protein